MDELRQVKRERRGLNAEPLGDDTGRQTRRPYSDQQSKQRQPGFLGEGTESGDRAFFIHYDGLQRFNNGQNMWPLGVIQEIF